jgi:hypothetical protein
MSGDENSRKQNSEAAAPDAPLSDRDDFVAGQELLCKVLAKEPGGYTVQIQLNDQSGFLQSGPKITIGEMIMARYAFFRDRHVLTWNRNYGQPFGQAEKWLELPDPE